MKIKFLTLILVTLCLKLYSVDLAKLEDLLDKPEVWSTGGEKLVESNSKNPYLQWLSLQSKDSARYPASDSSPKMSFLDQTVVEAIFRFTHGKLSKIELSLYNRGDVGEISVERFQKILDNATQKISEWTRDKGGAIKKERLATGMRLERKAWVKDNLVAIEMRWSVSDLKRYGDRPEYIKLDIFPFDPKNDPRKQSTSTANKDSDLRVASKPADLKKNLKKDENGYIFIQNVPMVDQGDKGYCAVASAETVLRYYGADVDQHIIAQLADSSGMFGTDPEKMYDMLKKVSTKFGVKVKEYFNFDHREFQKMMKDYNAVAKSKKKPEINTDGVVYLDTVYREMDLEILKEAKVKRQKTEFAKFKKTIEDNINNGIPLLWGLQLGLVKENPELPQAFGGHMRIIKGYNIDKDEIVYSDTWGKGHEWKTMNIEDAFAITTGLYSMEPRTK